MFSNHPVRSWAKAVVAAAILFTAYTPAAASDDVRAAQARLDAAEAVLAHSAGTLNAAQLSTLSATLSSALETEHLGLQTSALRLVIAYGDVVEFGRSTVIDVVKLYRNHDDDQVRRMAVVALGAMQDEWGIDFLTRSLRFENSKPVKHTVAAVVAAARADA